MKATIKDMERQQIIIDLIADDLLNYRLIAGLNTLGVIAADYYQSISTSVLKLIGFSDEERTDELYDFYEIQMLAIKDLEGAPELSQLSEIATKIYAELLTKQKGECLAST